jgi:flagellar M-ring protein FliF
MANSIVTVSNQVRGFSRMPLERQIGLIVALAAAVTLVASIFMWLTRPSYTTLYPNLNDQDSARWPMPWRATASVTGWNPAER